MRKTTARMGLVCGLLAVGVAHAQTQLPTVTVNGRSSGAGFGGTDNGARDPGDSNEQTPPEDERPVEETPKQKKEREQKEREEECKQRREKREAQIALSESIEINACKDKFSGEVGKIEGGLPSISLGPLINLIGLNYPLKTCLETAEIDANKKRDSAFTDFQICRGPR